jgi:surfeit locus 1 family protein
MTAFLLVMLPVTVALGSWQLDREADKLALQTAYYERLGGLPMTAPQRLEGLDFARVRLTGRYLPGRHYLVDNRTDRGRSGYWVVTVFEGTDGRRWLVNRGWVAAPSRREQLPEVPTPDALQTLIGVVWPDTGLPPLLADDPWPETWPRRVQRLDIARMAGLDGGTEPVEVRLEAGQPGVFSAAPVDVDFAPERHRGYAVQWFSLAGVLLMGYLIFGFSRRANEPAT